MFKQNSKYRLIYLMLSLGAFVYGSLHSFYQYSIGEDKRMSMIGGIFFGAMAIFQVVDLYEFIKNKKRINS